MTATIIALRPRAHFGLRKVEALAGCVGEALDLARAADRRKAARIQRARIEQATRKALAAMGVKPPCPALSRAWCAKVEYFAAMALALAEEGKALGLHLEAVTFRDFQHIAETIAGEVEARL